MGSNSTRTLQKLACAGACDDDFHELAYGPGTMIGQSSRNKKATGVAQVSTMIGQESSLYWSMCWQEREKYAEFVTTTNNEAVMVGEVIGTGHILKEPKSDLMWPDWLPFNSWNLELLKVDYLNTNKNRHIERWFLMVLFSYALTLACRSKNWRTNRKRHWRPRRSRKRL